MATKTLKFFILPTRYKSQKLADKRAARMKLKGWVCEVHKAFTANAAKNADLNEIWTVRVLDICEPKFGNRLSIMAGRDWENVEQARRAMKNMTRCGWECRLTECESISMGGHFSGVRNTYQIVGVQRGYVVE